MFPIVKDRVADVSKIDILEQREFARNLEALNNAKIITIAHSVLMHTVVIVGEIRIPLHKLAYVLDMSQDEVRKFLEKHWDVYNTARIEKEFSMKPELKAWGIHAGRHWYCYITGNHGGNQAYACLWVQRGSDDVEEFVFGQKHSGPYIKGSVPQTFTQWLGCNTIISEWSNHSIAETEEAFQALLLRLGLSETQLAAVWPRVLS